MSLSSEEGLISDNKSTPTPPIVVCSENGTISSALPKPNSTMQLLSEPPKSVSISHSSLNNLLETQSNASVRIKDSEDVPKKDKIFANGTMILKRVYSK